MPQYLIIIWQKELDRTSVLNHAGLAGSFVQSYLLDKIRSGICKRHSDKNWQTGENLAEKESPPFFTEFRKPKVIGWTPIQKDLPTPLA